MEVLRRYEIKIELLFKIVYFLFAAGSFCPFIYASSVQSVFVKLVLIVGVVLLFFRLADWKSYIHMPGLFWLGLFVLSFLFSAVMNRKYGISENFKWEVWLLLQIGCLYTCNLNRSKASYEKEFGILSHIALGYGMIAAVLSLYQLVQGISLKWTTADGEVMLSGYHWGRLWGIYTDPNYGAVFYAVCVWIAGYYFWKVKKWWRYSYLVSIVLSFLYIGFSDSRTGKIMLCAGIGMFLVLDQMSRKKEKRNWRAVLAGGGIALVMVLIFFAGIGQLQSIFYQKQTADMQTVQTIQKEEKVQPKQTIQSEREQNLESDLSNGRLALWKSGLEIWKTSPVYGTGYSTVVDYAKEQVKGTYIIQNSQGDYHNLHNQLINVLVYQGSIGVVILVLTFGYFVRYLWKGFGKTEHRSYELLLLCGIGMICIAMIFLLEGFYTNSPGAFLFWTFSGYLMHQVYQNTKKTEE